MNWSEELTDLAIKNQTHKKWAVTNPADMLKCLRMIGEKESGYPISSKEELRAAVGTDNYDFLDRLRGFGFVCERIDDQGIEVFFPSKDPQFPGFRTGEFLATLIRDHGINNPDALDVIGHNFILVAQVSLEFCAAMQRPGLKKDALKTRFLNHLVFNNKLNSFKFDNLLEFLIDLGIIEEEKPHGLFRISHSPSPLTFYCMTERYLLEADYEVGNRVNAGDLECYLDRVLPPAGDKRDMKFENIGLSRFPFEGWGKYDTWLTNAGFYELLKLGLIHPLSVAKVVKKLVNDPRCESREVAQQGIMKIRENFLLRLKGDSVTKPIWEQPPAGLERWRHVLEFDSDPLQENTTLNT